MPIYPGRRKATFRVTVWTGGKQHEEIVEGTRADALEHEARMRLELGARSRLRQRIAPVFSAFCAEDYEPHARAHLGADTWRKVRSYQVATLAAFFEDKRLSDLTPQLVDAYIALRRETVQATSINNELRVLGTMLRYARSLGYPVAELPIKRLTQVRRRPHVWTAAEVRQLFRAAEQLDEDLVPVIVFLVNTGMRKGEAIAARWTWYDERARVLHLGPTDTWAPKTKRPREVPVSDALARTLSRLPRSSPYIFPNALGEPFACFPNTRFADVVRAAGLRGGPHTCRHTFASLFLSRRPDLPELAALLGHSTTRTTELYAHLLPGHLERARNVVDLAPARRNPGKTLAR